MNNAFINERFLWGHLFLILLDISICVDVFVSLGYVPRSWITGSYGNSILNYLKSCWAQWLHILHSYQQSTNIPFPLILTLSVCLFSYSHPSVVVSFILVEWNLIVLSICISLVTNGVEHLFMCLLAVGEMSIQIFYSYFIWGLGFLSRVVRVIYVF